MDRSGRGTARLRPVNRRDFRLAATGAALCLWTIIFFRAAVVWGQPLYDLKGITLEDAPGEFTVIIWSDPPIDDVHYAFPRKPPRLAIDLPGKWKRPGKRLYRLENDTVKKITADRSRDNLRVILHLKTPQIFEPFIYDSLKGLIVTIKKAHLFNEALPGGVAVRMADDEDEDRTGPPTGDRDGRPRKAGSAAGAVGGNLTDVSVAPLAEGFRLTLSLDRESGEYTTFTLLEEKPPKVVLDLEGAWQYPGETVQEVQNGSLRQIRVGEHTDRLRVVMDLVSPRKPVIQGEAKGRQIMLEVRQPAP